MTYQVKKKKAWGSKLVLFLLFAVVILGVVVAAVLFPGVGKGIAGLGAWIGAGIWGFLTWIAVGQTIVTVAIIGIVGFIVIYRKSIFASKKTVIANPLMGSAPTPYMSNIPTQVMNPVTPPQQAQQQDVVTEVKPSA